MAICSIPKTHLALAALLYAASVQSFAAPPPASVNEAARQALAAQKYDQVLAAYDGYTDLSAIALYRSAIAQARLNKPVLAHGLLQQAMDADPTGRFASSPQRLESFLDGILNACAAQDLPGCEEEKFTAPPKITPAPSHLNGEALSAATPPDPAAAVTPAAPPALAAPHPLASPPQPSIPDAPISMNESYDTWTWALMGLMMAATAAASVWITRVQMRRKQKREALPPLEALHAAVMQQLQIASPGTKIFQSLNSLVPLLEQEAGRAHFLKTQDPSRLNASDLWQTQVAAQFEKTPMTVSNASAEQVKALFQSKRWA